MLRCLIATLLTIPALASGAVAQEHVHLDAGMPQATQQEVQLVAAAIERYRDFNVAKRQGWKPFGGDEALMGQHFVHEKPDIAPDYVHGQPLDFTRPNNLMYTKINGRMVLTGVAFVVRIGDGEPAPEGFSGAADRWHVHDAIRAMEAAVEERPIVGALMNWWVDANYRRKGDNRGRLAMVHVWATLPNPDGIFADYNRTLPYLKLGLPPGWSDGASEDAARGLNLATEDACDSFDGALWIATATSAQSRKIKAACREAAGRVEASLGAGGAAEVNRAGEDAWSIFDGVWRDVLTDRQEARVAAMTEHGHDHGAAHQTHAPDAPHTAPGGHVH